MNRSIEISHRTIFFIAGFLLIVWLLFQIKEVILLLFIAIILMSALAPLIETITKRKIPKVVAIAVSYLLIIALLAFLLFLIIIPLKNQTTSLVSALPQTAERLLPSLGIDRSLLQQELSSFSKSVLELSFALFSNILTVISVAVLTFYLLLDRDRLYHLLVSIVPGQKANTERLIHKIENKLGAWLRGQIILSLLIGTSYYILLFAFGISFALPLAIFAGFMEVIPVIGPIISALPAIVIGFSLSPTVGIGIALGCFVIQQLENHFIVPQLMKRAVGLNPLIVILAIAVGSKLLGIAGGLLAVPITVVLQVLLEEYLGINLDEYSNDGG